MATILKNPFESEYGFKSNGFSVDENGNITATSIFLQEEQDSSTTPADFTVTEASGAFTFTGLGSLPALTLERSKRYLFDISLTNLEWYIFASDQTSAYNFGVSFSDGTTGGLAQGNQQGRFSFSVPIDAPDLLYYGDLTTGQVGRIDIVDPVGKFSTLELTSTTASSLVLQGGANISGPVTVDNLLSAPNLTVQDIGSDAELRLAYTTRIEVLASDSSLLGIINDEGSTIPINSTTVNNTVIGNETPSTATFTTASITGEITQDTDVTTKNYVDTTATALSIAFGL